ncbi:MAG: hypothetical protein AABW51_01425 [Nanoarchaeota archaeon]
MWLDNLVWDRKTRKEIVKGLDEVEDMIKNNRDLDKARELMIKAQNKYNTYRICREEIPEVSTRFMNLNYYWMSMTTLVYMSSLRTKAG